MCGDSMTLIDPKLTVATSRKQPEAVIEAANISALNPEATRYLNSAL
jgi:hypothetical protein